ncbi:hypothetical protein GGR55DRAFT_251380 [Xylaria sp. FL0064]|nr:hypothetical protein GGR55DRAFT_251380 [Xylaria sp. FL0064]
MRGNGVANYVLPSKLAKALLTLFLWPPCPKWPISHCNSEYSPCVMQPKDHLNSHSPRSVNFRLSSAAKRGFGHCSNTRNKLRVRARSPHDASIASVGQTQPPAHRDARYDAIVENRQRPSGLLFVNRDSRDAALSHYRVQIPCWFTSDSTNNSFPWRPGTLYFSPERDFLWIRNGMGHVADFLHDLRTVHDPRQVGLLNLAVDRNARMGFRNIDPTLLDPSVQKSYKETLCQLREVLLVEEHIVGRHVIGRAGVTDWDYRLNRAFPVSTAIPEFHIVGPDPRPIGQHLGNIFLWGDPCSAADLFSRYVHSYLKGDRDMPQTRFRVLLTFDSGNKIHSCQDAEEWLRKEEDMWTSETSLHVPGQVIVEGSENSPVSTAFGFWLFSLDAFGGLPQSSDQRRESSRARYLCLREHWPELALCDIS